MFKLAIVILRFLCIIVAVSAIFFKIVENTEIGKRFWDFVKTHKTFAKVFLIMIAIGLLSVAFS